MDVSSPVAIGSDFLGYRIEEPIGRGGMGVVYRAYDLRLKRPVALKLVAPSLARDDRFRERFARESELVMSLEHPNVVPIYDAGDVDGRVYLAMRLVDGSDLGSLLRAEGALEPPRAIAICAQVAAALDAAHARGLVHRDVKPSNVLLDASEHAYLADFGLTRRLDDEERQVGEDRSLGTPAYLAPEQLESGPIDGRADVYSLGCVLYECLTGEAVFQRTSRLAVAWAHLEDEPPKPSRERPELTEAIDAVVARALAKDRELRYPTCAALVAAAGAALGLGTPRTSRRRRTLLLVAATAALAIAATAVLATSFAHGARKPPHLFAAPNELARIDPSTRRVDAVVGVGLNPVLAAGSGRHVWVYSEATGIVSEVDTQTTRVIKRRLISLLIPAECCGLYSGPVMTADSSGAWFVRGGLIRRAYLTHIPIGTRQRAHSYPLDITPTGVAVGEGSVWVVGHTSRDDEVLRIDPADGRVTARRRFPASAGINSIAVGYGWVWVVSSEKATLYRIDPKLRRTLRSDRLANTRATRPELIEGNVWIRVEGHNGEVFWIDPSSLHTLHWEFDGPPTGYENVYGIGALWRYDSPSGKVIREAEQNGPEQAIQVTRKLPTQGGPCLSSITIADGSVWVTTAPLTDEGDSFVCQR